MAEAEIKLMIRQLGKSINASLAESPQINERLQEIRDAGYNVFLVIEAKVGFSRKGKEGDSDTCPSDESVTLQITPEDAKFLKSLKISSN
jgi:hypothetical protein